MASSPCPGFSPQLLRLQVGFSLSILQVGKLRPRDTEVASGKSCLADLSVGLLLLSLTARCPCRPWTRCTGTCPPWSGTCPGTTAPYTAASAQSRRPSFFGSTFNIRWAVPGNPPSPCVGPPGNRVAWLTHTGALQVPGAVLSPPPQEPGLVSSHVQMVKARFSEVKAVACPPSHG